MLSKLIERYIKHRSTNVTNLAIYSAYFAFHNGRGQLKIELPKYSCEIPIKKPLYDKHPTTTNILLPAVEIKRSE